MANLKEALSGLREVINSVISKKIDFENKIAESEFDFKKKEREYYLNEVSSALKRFEAVLSESFVSSGKGSERAELAKVADKVREFKAEIRKKNFAGAFKMINSTLEICPSIKISDADLPKSDFFLPKVPRDIYVEIKASFDELVKCYEHSCYRSALILCGRILELALHYKYLKVTGRDLLEKAPDIGLGSLVLRFKDKNISLDPGLSNQIHLINQLRIASVHKKKQSFNPTKAQSKATILYTLDTLKKLFKD